MLRLLVEFAQRLGYILIDRDFLNHRFGLCRLSLSDQNIELLDGDGQQFFRFVLGSEIFGCATEF